VSLFNRLLFRPVDSFTITMVYNQELYLAIEWLAVLRVLGQPSGVLSTLGSAFRLDSRHSKEHHDGRRSPASVQYQGLVSNHRAATTSGRCALSSHREYRHLLLRLGQSSLAREERRLSIRESLGTFILGALSTSIGVVVLVALAPGMVGHASVVWTQQTIAGHAAYFIRTEVYGITALIGEFLGLAGILLARSRHGSISPLSSLGTLICLSHFVLFFSR
jgi:hypothetical protein